VITVHYRILGPLEVHWAGRTVQLRGEQQRRLLAVLLLNAGTIVHFERLIDELWPVPPVTARRQVYNLASALRVSIAGQGGPPDAIQTSAAGYQIRLEPGELDAEVFREHLIRADLAVTAGLLEEAVRQLTAGLGLWRGPVLADLGGTLAHSAVAMLDEQRGTALERLYSLRLRLGETTSLISDLVRLVAEHPLREPLRASLMLALSRAGRQADALAVYDEGRRRLADTLGIDPGTELRLVHEQILRGESVYPASGSTGAAAVPSNLPYDTADFTGREPDIGRLIGELGSGAGAAPAIAVISGMGGVGKTALAVHLAHRLAVDHPEGQYFADLHGFAADQDPVQPADALGTLLRQAGVPQESISPDLAARSLRWRDQVANRRVVVVLDNVFDAAQIRDLIPAGPGAAVLVTSRRGVMALEGAASLSLDPLSPSESIRLFSLIAGAERVGAEPEAVAEVVRRCGGLPLALRIAASRFRQRPAWTVAHLAGLLADPRRRALTLAVSDRSVASVLSASYRHLDVPRQRLFRLISLNPGPELDVQAAAALAGIPAGEAEEALEELTECNLLTQQTLGRYRFHFLVRDFAREEAERTDTEAQLSEARHRLLEYYLRRAGDCPADRDGPMMGPNCLAFH
jgi:DNA-binding SARP family transcriptional activator